MAWSGTEQLNASQKALLKTSWAIVEPEKEDAAVKIFVLIFEQCPETKRLFYFSNKVTPEMDNLKEYKKNKEFRFHALRFIQIIQNGVDMLQDFEALEPVLKNLGQMHARFQESRGFDVLYWNVFVECTIFVIRKYLVKASARLGSDKIDDAITAWRVLLVSIVQQMQHGFRSGNLNRQLSRNNSNRGEPPKTDTASVKTL